MRNNFPAFLIIFLLLGISVGSASAAPDIDLKFRREKINGAATTHTDEWNLWILTRAFDVAPSVVERMRNAGQDWGQACIRFALAKELAKNKPNLYPKLTDAIPELDDIQFDEEDWVDQASEKMDLAPVLDTVIDMQDEFANPDPFPIGSQIFRPLKPHPRNSPKNSGTNTAPRQQPVDHRDATTGRGMP